MATAPKTGVLQRCFIARDSRLPDQQKSAFRGDLSDFCGTIQEILQQGRISEALGKAARKKAEERQAVKPMSARITEVQKDFRTAIMERDDALGRTPQQFGQGLEQAHLLAGQVKQISGDTVRTAGTTTTALADIQN